MTEGRQYFPPGPHVGQPWLTACYTFTKSRVQRLVLHITAGRTEKDGGEKYRAKNSVKSWSMNWQLLAVKTFLQSASELMRDSTFFHGVPKRKIKTEGEFVMLGRKSGAGNPLLHDSLCHCLALCLTGLKSVWMMLVMKRHDNHVHSVINRIWCFTGLPIINID